MTSFEFDDVTLLRSYNHKYITIKVDLTPFNKGILTRRVVLKDGHNINEITYQKLIDNYIENFFDNPMSKMEIKHCKMYCSYDIINKINTNKNKQWSLNQILNKNLKVNNYIFKNDTKDSVEIFPLGK